MNITPTPCPRRVEVEKGVLLSDADMPLTRGRLLAKKGLKFFMCRLQAFIHTNMRNRSRVVLFCRAKASGLHLDQRDTTRVRDNSGARQVQRAKKAVFGRLTPSLAMALQIPPSA